jgi:hypothetical protein
MPAAAKSVRIERARAIPTAPRNPPNEHTTALATLKPQPITRSCGRNIKIVANRIATQVMYVINTHGRSEEQSGIFS